VFYGYAYRDKKVVSVCSFFVRIAEEILFRLQAQTQLELQHHTQLPSQLCWPVADDCQIMPADW
jgi:hypothetical protein